MKYLTASTLVTALGRGRDVTLQALENERSGLELVSEAGLELYVGSVKGIDAIELPDGYAEFDCRNNRLAELALQTDDFEERIEAAIAHHGRDRIGIFLATSTSGISETEAAYRELGEDDALPAEFAWDTKHRLSATTEYVRMRLGLEGPSQSISTACSSSAKVIASAARYIDAGLCDAAIVGGVDSVCRTTLFGFHSLELTAKARCRPFSADRDGMCIGEAAALGLIERADRASDGVAVLGHGESTDAHHMSTPHPEALGARLAMRRALENARLSADRVDYVNLHGTATPANDSAEDLALARELGTTVPCSSTKGWTGHTLGAAGMVETLLSKLALETGVAPKTLNTERLDDAMRCNILLENRQRDLRCVLSNSFGFGGNNCALLLGYPS